MINATVLPGILPDSGEYVWKSPSEWMRLIDVKEPASIEMYSVNQALSQLYQSLSIVYTNIAHFESRRDLAKKAYTKEVDNSIKRIYKQAVSNQNKVPITRILEALVDTENEEEKATLETLEAYVNFWNKALALLIAKRKVMDSMTWNLSSEVKLNKTY